jgi:hypothetical protein
MQFDHQEDHVAQPPSAVLLSSASSSTGEGAWATAYRTAIPHCNGNDRKTLKGAVRDLLFAALKRSRSLTQKNARGMIEN